jgi:two-component system chemotaxis response regulator CheY
MAILIVDDENQTRAALRELLEQMGHKTILEAKHGEEALKIAEREKTRLRLIVADWEMPVMDGITLLGRVAERPELDLAPFLLITSDLPKAELQALRKKTSRLDNFLIKPFRLSALEAAVNEAQAQRAAARDVLVIYGAELASRAEALRAESTTSKSWRTIVSVSTPSELDGALAEHGRRLGALAIQPDAPIATWLAAFVKTPLGVATPIVCASRNAQRIFPVRTYCQRFIDGDLGGDPAGTLPPWIEALGELRHRATHALELELAFQELKASQQARQTEAARKQAEAILKLDPASTEGHAILAELLEAAGSAQAPAEYTRAIALHPCQPKPHIKLLNLLAAPPQNAAAVREAAERAVQYCPQNQDVLLAAARAFEAVGDAASLQGTASRILTLNPKHAEALRLLGQPGPGA